MKVVDGKPMTKVVVLYFDNVQHMKKQREARIGAESVMIIGVAGTARFMEVPEAACDLADKRRRIALNERQSLTMDSLLDMIDFPHLREVGILQWIQALATYVPELSVYSTEISLRYRTRVAKRPIPLEKTPIHPLATSGKNEAYIPDLKDCFLDFLQQLGQTESDFDLRLWICGGDGMSYNNMLLLKKYLKDHPDAFQRFELMEPILLAWHTMWTDLSRLFETHWGSPLNDNPATLGNSAKIAGRAPPSNLKKVDYYPAAELLNLVHDTRMLDCWRYFSALHSGLVVSNLIYCRLFFKTDDIHEFITHRASIDQLPSFEDLEHGARALFDTYCTTRADHACSNDVTDGSSEWSTHVPLGTPWVPPIIDKTSIRSKPVLPKKNAKKTKTPKAAPKTSSEKPDSTIFKGDHVLRDCRAFFKDASISREAAYAAAGGDVGRLWEALKVGCFFGI